MAKEPTPKLDRLRELREQNYERMMAKSRATIAAELQSKKRELQEQVRAIEGDGPKVKPVKRKVSRKKR